MSLGPAIALKAKGHVGSTAWAYDKAKDEFGKNTNKCNKFVYDVIVEAGVSPPPRVVGRSIWLPIVGTIPLTDRPPTAAEWATASVMIPGWVVVTNPQPGDVAAEAHQYSDATGHCGVVVEAGQTASASAHLNGTIVQNDWGFRSGQTVTFRRHQ